MHPATATRPAPRYWLGVIAALAIIALAAAMSASIVIADTGLTPLNIATLAAGVAATVASALLMHRAWRMHIEDTTEPYPLDMQIANAQRARAGFDEVLAIARKLTPDQAKTIDDAGPPCDVARDAFVALAVHGRITPDTGPGSLRWCLAGIYGIGDAVGDAALAVIARDLIPPAVFNQLTERWIAVGYDIPGRAAHEHYTIQLRALTDNGWVSFDPSTMPVHTAVTAKQAITDLAWWYLRQPVLATSTWLLRAWPGEHADTGARPAAGLSYHPPRDGHHCRSLISTASR